MQKTEKYRGEDDSGTKFLRVKGCPWDFASWSSVAPVVSGVTEQEGHHAQWDARAQGGTAQGRVWSLPSVTVSLPVILQRWSAGEGLSWEDRRQQVSLPFPNDHDDGSQKDNQDNEPSSTDAQDQTHLLRVL